MKFKKHGKVYHTSLLTVGIIVFVIILYVGMKKDLKDTNEKGIPSEFISTEFIPTQINATKNITTGNISTTEPTTFVQAETPSPPELEPELEPEPTAAATISITEEPNFSYPHFYINKKYAQIVGYPLVVSLKSSAFLIRIVDNKYLETKLNDEIVLVPLNAETSLNETVVFTHMFKEADKSVLLVSNTVLKKTGQVKIILGDFPLIMKVHPAPTPDESTCHVQFEQLNLNENKIAKVSTNTSVNFVYSCLDSYGNPRTDVFFCFFFVFCFFVFLVFLNFVIQNVVNMNLW